METSTSWILISLKCVGPTGQNRQLIWQNLNDHTLTAFHIHQILPGSLMHCLLTVKYGLRSYGCKQGRMIEVKSGCLALSLSDTCSCLCKQRPQDAFHALRIALLTWIDWSSQKFKIHELDNITWWAVNQWTALLLKGVENVQYNFTEMASTTCILVTLIIFTMVVTGIRPIGP